MPIKGVNSDNVFGGVSRLPPRTAATRPQDLQPCQFGKGGAIKSLLFSDRSDYVPVCRAHEQEARAYIRKQKSGVDDVVKVNTNVPLYREDRMLEGKKSQDAEDVAAIIDALRLMFKYGGMRASIDVKYVKQRLAVDLHRNRVASLLTKHGDKIAKAFGHTKLRKRDGGGYQRSGRGAFGHLGGGGTAGYSGTDWVFEAAEEDEDPILAMALAEPDENSRFGQAHSPTRRASAMEAKRIMAPIKAYEPDPATDRRPVQLPGDKVKDKKQSPRGTKGLAPKTLLKMLGTDWKTWRMTKIHDNRLNVFVDGNRFTIYTRRG